MDDFDDLQTSEFVTDNEDQDSLDEKIDSEQQVRNKQLWNSFQNAACCITELFRDRTQPNLSPWVPFQNAASNLTTLYRDCIESQRKFARIGYQVGRQKKMRDIKKLLKKHKITSSSKQQTNLIVPSDHDEHVSISTDPMIEDTSTLSPEFQQHNNNNNINNGAVSSILAVNQLNLGSGCDDTPASHSVTAQPFNHQHHQQQQHQPQQQQQQLLQTPQSNLQIVLSSNEDDLLTFQQALTQPAAINRGIKSNQNRRPCSNSSGYFNSRAIDAKTEEERLLELNQFLSDEYQRHVGSRKRSCSNHGGSHIKRLRE